MHSRNENLEAMVNQLAAFFVPQAVGDQTAAARAIASHLKLFWPPVMRRQLFALYDAGALNRSDPASLRALECHRDELLTSSAAAPTKKEVLPEGGGDAG
jgi:hypothetical protein